MTLLSRFLSPPAIRNLSTKIGNPKVASALRVIWIAATTLGIIYFLLVYLFPLVLSYNSPLIPTKYLIEYSVFTTSLITGLLLTTLTLFLEKPFVSIDNEILLLKMANHITAMCCLELTSVSGSVVLDANGRPKYSTAFLHAIRNGINQHVTISYEVGVVTNEPYIRLYITSTGQNLLDIKRLLRREATRIETILIATLKTVELTLIKGKNLQTAISFDTDRFSSRFSRTESAKDKVYTQLLVLQGLPSSLPSYEISQIGTLLSTAVKKGYSIRFNCTFSRSNPRRRKGSLEAKWRNIREREKRNEDTLFDQAAKKKLVDEYEEIEDDSAWFQSSTYLIAESHEKDELDWTVEGVVGLVLSLWGNDGSISISRKNLSQRTILRLMTRRHIKPQAMHINRLVAFINTPIQKLPVLTPIETPDFNIPPKELVENELTVGHVIFGGRRIGRIGLKSDWLRQHVAILGATGTGKTTLVKHLMAQMSQKTNVPWWIFDLKGSEYLDLIPYSPVDILVIRPGLDSSFVISLIDTDSESNSQNVHTTFVLLRELLKERNTLSELSPAMEKLLRQAVTEMATSSEENYSITMLNHIISELAEKDGLGKLTRDALLNRLEILTQEPLGSILAGGKEAIRISKLLNRRVIFDLRYVAQTGGMEAARILYNLIAKRIFDFAMQRGIKPGIHHVVVLEEASNLVPQSYTKLSAADVTTGESMVLLQRATGQGVIVVSTRPNISSNILANTGTKFAFRLPYDSATGARFMSLNESQERYLRTLKRGRALTLLPNFGSFEIATDPFTNPPYLDSRPIQTSHHDSDEPITQPRAMGFSENSSEHDSKDDQANQSDRAMILDRIGELANYVVAYLASENTATYSEMKTLVSTLIPDINDQDMEEIISDLVSLETIEREPLSLIDEGFLFTLPGRGQDAVKDAIVSYIVASISSEHIIQKHPDCPEGLDLIIDDRAVLVLPEHLNAASLSPILRKIRNLMKSLGNTFIELIVIIRGSMASAKLRESMSKSAEFDAVSIVPAFPSSIDKLSEELFQKQTSRIATTDNEDTTESVSVIGSVHDIGSATNREIQMRLWFNLIQEFVEISGGKVEWKNLLSFISTTAIQSTKGRTTWMNEEDGLRALTELLADEVLVAIRLGIDHNLADMKTGLWIVNPVILQSIKETTVKELERRLAKQEDRVATNHSYYDLCAGAKSYVIFPTQQELNTLLHLHSKIACRTCKTSEVVCLVTAEEYIDDKTSIPSNYILLTMEEGITAVPT